jgi:hypothetical protein
MTELLKYKDKEYPYRVSFRAIAGLQRDTRKSLNDALASIEDIESINSLLYHSLSQGHKDEGLKFKLKKDDCYDLLEDGNLETFMLSVGNFFLKMEKGQETKSQN